LIAGEQRNVHIVGQLSGIDRQQIAADPGPQGLQRLARDSTRMIVVGARINQKRFERLEEQPRAMADARRALALLAHDGAQFLQDQIGAGGIVTGQKRAFELSNQQGARPRREFAQVLP
jgi:hypothetical protein